MDPSIAAVAAELILRQTQGRRPVLLERVKELQKRGEIPSDPSDAAAWLIQALGLEQSTVT